MIPGLGAAGAALPGAGGTASAQAQSVDAAEVFNFVLNLEYLEAELYLRDDFGRGLADADISGIGTLDAITGGRPVDFTTPLLRGYANEIATDEENYVRFLRAILGNSRITRPAINFVDSFDTLARFSGLGNTFDGLTNETNFPLAAFVFEDVGITAYQGGVSPDPEQRISRSHRRHPRRRSRSCRPHAYGAGKPRALPTGPADL